MGLKNLVLNIDQMQNLNKLGLKVKDTVFTWEKIELGNEHIHFEVVETDIIKDLDIVSKEDVPALTLQEILKLLPEEIDNQFGFSMEHNKIIYKSILGTAGNDYEFEGNTLLEVAYNALCWMLKNKYI